MSKLTSTQARQYVESKDACDDGAVWLGDQRSVRAAYEDVPNSLWLCWAAFNILTPDQTHEVARKVANEMATYFVDLLPEWQQDIANQALELMFQSNGAADRAAAVRQRMIQVGMEEIGGAAYSAMFQKALRDLGTPQGHESFKDLIKGFCVALKKRNIGDKAYRKGLVISFFQRHMTLDSLLANIQR